MMTRMFGFCPAAGVAGAGVCWACAVVPATVASATAVPESSMSLRLTPAVPRSRTSGLSGRSSLMPHVLLNVADAANPMVRARRSSSSRSSCRRRSSPRCGASSSALSSLPTATGGRRRTRARRRCGGRSARSARPSPAVVHCSIWRSPSELPNAMIGRRPMNRLMPTGLPGPSSTNSTSGSFIEHRLAVAHLEARARRLLPTTCSGGMP